MDFAARLVGIAALVLPVMAGAQECPANPEISAKVAEIFTELQGAQSERDAQPLSALLWREWMRAPDTRAQDMLEAGMSARDVFDFARARAAFDALIAYCPDYPEGYNQRAFVWFLQGDFAAAKKDLDRVLVLDPTHVAAIAGLGLTLQNLGQKEAAQEAFRRAVRLHPWLPERVFIEGAEKPDDAL